MNEHNTSVLLGTNFEISLSSALLPDKNLRTLLSSTFASHCFESTPKVPPFYQHLPSFIKYLHFFEQEMYRVKIQDHSVRKQNVENQ